MLSKHDVPKAKDVHYCRGVLSFGVTTSADCSLSIRENPRKGKSKSDTRPDERNILMHTPLPRCTKKRRMKIRLVETKNWIRRKDLYLHTGRYYVARIMAEITDPKKRGFTITEYQFKLGAQEARALRAKFPHLSRPAVRRVKVSAKIASKVTAAPAPRVLPAFIPPLIEMPPVAIPLPIRPRFVRQIAVAAAILGGMLILTP